VPGMGKTLKYCYSERKCFLLDTETFGCAEAKSHQMNGALDGGRDAMSLRSVSNGIRAGSGTNRFCECLLTLWAA